MDGKVVSFNDYKRKKRVGDLTTTDVYFLCINVLITYGMSFFLLGKAAVILPDSENENKIFIFLFIVVLFVFLFTRGMKIFRLVKEGCLKKELDRLLIYPIMVSLIAAMGIYICFENQLYVSSVILALLFAVNGYVCAKVIRK